MEASWGTDAAPTPTGLPLSLTPGYLARMFREYQDSGVIRVHYNYTGKLNNRDGLKPEVVAFLVVCLLIVLENAVVLAAIWKNKKFHLPMYYLLGNLTLSDLLAGSTYMVNLLTSGATTLKLTPVLWFLREGCVFVTLAASIVSLLAIAIERYVTMVRMKPYQAGKRGRMFLLIAGSWALSVLLSVLPIMGWNCLGRLEACSTVLPLYAKSYVLFCISIFSAVLLAIVVMYARIFRIVKANTQRPVAGAQRKGLARRSKKYVALLKTVTIVLGVFIACWLPLFALFLLDFCCPARGCGVLLKAEYFLALAIINSLLNPIIYTLTSKDIRRAILRLLCRRCLMTKDGQVKKLGMPFLECSTTTKTEKTSHRLETTFSSGNFTPSTTIKAIYPRVSKI